MFITGSAVDEVMTGYRSASSAVPPMARAVVGPMYPGRPVVRPDSSFLLPMSYAAKQTLRASPGSNLSNFWSITGFSGPPSQRACAGYRLQPAFGPLFQAETPGRATKLRAVFGIPLPPRRRPGESGAAWGSAAEAAGLHHAQPPEQQGRTGHGRSARGGGSGDGSAGGARALGARRGRVRWEQGCPW